MLFDDHIYDAWVEKAEELKLKPVTDTKAAAMSTEKDKSQAKEKSDKRDDHGLPVGNEFSSIKVIELHSPDSPAADPDSKVQEMIASLPSVPSVESNTPKPMDTDGDETNADDKTGNAAAALDKQKTYVASTAEQLVKRIEFPFFHGHSQHFFKTLVSLLQKLFRRIELSSAFRSAALELVSSRRTDLIYTISLVIVVPLCSFSVEMRDANSDSFNTMPTTESEPTTDRGQDETAKVAPVPAPRKSSASSVQPTE